MRPSSYLPRIIDIQLPEDFPPFAGFLELNVQSPSIAVYIPQGVICESSALMSLIKRLLT